MGPIKSAIIGSVGQARRLIAIRDVLGFLGETTRPKLEGEAMRLPQPYTGQAPQMLWTFERLT